MAETCGQQLRVGFIGAGEMASALLDGLLSTGKVEPERIVVTNRSSDERLTRARQTWGVRTTRKKRDLLETDLIVLAVKPADAATALTELRQAAEQAADRTAKQHATSMVALPGSRPVLLSLAAGVPTSAVEQLLGARWPVVRAMPNTSSRILESATALTAGSHASPADVELAATILATVGPVVEVAEEMLNAVTGLSGSGPAYVYLMVEGMIAAGVRAGLETAVARQLAVQTVFGAARMLKESGADPAELRRQVSSPNGTTVAALSLLQEADWPGILGDAVQRAVTRAQELGRLSAAAVDSSVSGIG